MIFRIPKDTEITLEVLGEFLDKHRVQVNERYKKLYDEYKSDHAILHEDAKPAYKPDNRIVVNFPKYCVDTMNGFFIGIPVKTVTEDTKVAEFVEFLNKYNDQEDNDAELSKVMSIFGRGYEMYFTDENSALCITYLTPMEAFMLYDDSIIERPMAFVRRYTDNDNIEWGSVSDKYGVRNFKITGGLQWVDKEWEPHYFGDVPATEFVENAERQGLFEPIRSIVAAYNKAISEKANDVDYFADAYMKILGTKLEGDDLQYIRSNRVINFDGDGTDKLVVEFMGKPEGDTTQENLLDRLERLIFQIIMVANISDENFGSASGISLKYKLQGMMNQFQNKKRKFESGMNRRYKLLFGHPASKIPADSWMQLEYHFTANIPANLLEEAQIAAQMEGITSHKTQLKVLSVVEDVQGELDDIEEENSPSEETIVDRIMFGKAEQVDEGEVLNG